MTTPEAATIAAIRKQAAERLRQTADALALIQTPIGRPGDTPAISALLSERSRLAYDTTQGKILTVSETAEALNLSRQRVYVLLEEERALRHQAEHELTSAENLAQLLTVSLGILKAGALTPERVAELTGWSLHDVLRLKDGRARTTPAHTQLPETAL